MTCTASLKQLASVRPGMYNARLLLRLDANGVKVIDVAHENDVIALRKRQMSYQRPWVIRVQAYI